MDGIEQYKDEEPQKHVGKNTSTYKPAKLDFQQQEMEDKRQGDAVLADFLGVISDDVNNNRDKNRDITEIIDTSKSSLEGLKSEILVPEEYRSEYMSLNEEEKQLFEEVNSLKKRADLFNKEAEALDEEELEIYHTYSFADPDMRKMLRNLNKKREECNKRGSEIVERWDYINKRLVEIQNRRKEILNKVNDEVKESAPEVKDINNG